VERIEQLYGKAKRIWVMDRGMISEENVGYLQEAGRRYIVGTPKSMLRRFERELLAKDWQQVHEGLEVRFCSALQEAKRYFFCAGVLNGERKNTPYTNGSKGGSRRD
jgi:hypothetical protein